MTSFHRTKWIFLFSVFVSLLFSHTSARPQKRRTAFSSTLPIDRFITEVHNNNYRYIVDGIPTLLVEDMVSRAIYKAAQNCTISNTEIDISCTMLFLTRHFTVKQIQAEIEYDSHRPSKDKYFPLYRRQRVKALTDWQKTILDDFLSYSLAHSTSFRQVSSSSWSGIFYPDEGVLYKDTATAIDNACNTIVSCNGNSSTKVSRVSAQIATAYIIGLVRELIHAGGDVVAANQLLERHVDFIFNSLRCTGEPWYQLRIPVSIVAKNVKVVQHSLEEVIRTSRNKILVERAKRALWNVPNMVHVANLVWDRYSWMIEYLSSWASFGRARFYIDEEDDRLLAISVSKDLASSPFRIPEQMGPPASRAPGCSMGWSLVHRAGFVPGSAPTCCAEPCESMKRHYSSLLCLAFDQEECCALCNYGSCPMGGMDRVVSLFVDNIEDRLAYVISL